jgi:hypothetical protein
MRCRPALPTREVDHPTCVCGITAQEAMESLSYRRRERDTIRRLYRKGDNRDHPYHLFHSPTHGIGSPDLWRRAVHCARYTQIPPLI